MAGDSVVAVDLSVILVVVVVATMSLITTICLVMVTCITILHCDLIYAWTDCNQFHQLTVYSGSLQ